MTTFALEQVTHASTVTPVQSVNGERFVQTGYKGVRFRALLLAEVDSSNDLRGEDLRGLGVGVVAEVLTSYADGSHSLITPPPEGVTNPSFWRVAELNPAPLHGMHYRTLAEDGGKLVQYIDDDHSDDRFTSDSPWNILYGSTAPWYSDRDSYASLDGLDYVRVELTEESNFLGKPEAETSPEAEASPDAQESPETVEEAAPAEPEPLPGNARALGLQKPNEDGTYAEPSYNSRPTGLVIAWQNYGFREGQAYLSSVVSGGKLKPLAHVTLNEDRTYSFAAINRQALWVDETFWVPAVMPPLDKIKAPESDPALVADVNAATLATLRARLTSAQTLFQTFNEDLNEVAKDKDWCSEYESSIEPYGMMPRESAERDYGVEVTAEVRIQVDSPSGRMDTDVVRNLGGLSSFSMSSLTIEASLRVTVAVTATSADAAEEMVDSAEIEEAVNNMLDDGSVDEVIDYTIEETNEA